MKSKKNLIVGISILAVLFISLTFLLLNVFIPFTLWVHPVLNFLFVMFVGFGILTLVAGFKTKNPWFFFWASVLLGLSMFYVLLNYMKLWWIVLIILVVFWAAMAVMSIMRVGSVEDVSLNKSPEYKTYDQRKAEEAAKAETEEKEEKPLPTLKSFKD